MAPMKIKIAWIGKTKSKAIDALTDDYLARISRYAPAEAVVLRSQEEILPKFGASAKGGKSTLVLMDSRGKEFSSEAFAGFLQNYLDRNPLPLVFVVGGADGFDATVKAKAEHVISLGKMTLPHELARIVLLEQIYRAFTILKGHPYHTGH
jgi:23S rRNA (pseudouridine1915-N3)-methyltransferase